MMSSERETVFSVFLTFLKLGCTSFGGPVAHIGYFREEFVVRRRWIDEHTYGDLVAFCQFLPGPASSQIGISIGLAKSGISGALAAWAGFTIPSALLLIAFGYGVILFPDVLSGGALHGLKIVAVAVVAQAVWGMAQTMCPDIHRITLAAVAAIIVLYFPSPFTQIAVIILGAVAGFVLQSGPIENRRTSVGIQISKIFANSSLFLFISLLILLPIAASTFPSQTLTLIDSFYRSGSMVFGGGHVVLPLLQSEVVPTGWVTNNSFLAGYGAAQAVPGPLFTFAAYLGTVMMPQPNGWLGGIICLLSIFLPSFFLVIGLLPYWDELRQRKFVQKALLGVNASVVGLLLAALYNPVWTSGILSPSDFALALFAFTLLVFWKVSPWLVVLLTTICSGGLSIVIGAG